MTNIIIKNGRVVDPANSLDGAFDVIIENGLISDVVPAGKGGHQGNSIDATGCIVAPGFVDVHTHLRDPGYEYKETIRSGTGAAVSGGITSVCCMANTDPVNDSASVTNYILKQARETGYCHVYPIGAITRGLKGEDLASIAELRQAGCVAISDDGLTVQNAKLMRLALEYAKSFGIPVSTHSVDADLCAGGCMNESRTSTKLGLPGVPNAAEDVIIARDIMLAELTGAHLHVGHLSTEGGVRLVREAKKRGVHVTCEVTPHHFSLTDEAVGDYDTNAKMCPPLRSAADVEAIKSALRAGDVVDAIATDHAPHGITDKEVEFDKAAWGIIGFETMLPLTLQLVRDGFLTLSQMVSLLTMQPAKVFNLEAGTLTRGAVADVTLFNLDHEWIFGREQIFSKSKNSPFIGRTFKGRVVKTIVGGVVRFDAGQGLL
jgi:dihydroorotase